MSKDDELEHHLADRLAEQRDFASFSRARPGGGLGGTPEGESVAREIEIAGAEHLGGRKIQDRFTRSGSAKPVVAPANPDLPPRKRKLEHHLEARLKEVQDEMVSSPTDAALRAYQDLRKRMGGS